ncbi:MAG: hypothetical protein SFV15_22355 [Polyangiaceae bacterium]|nr:hypothetical protein [Polyangiaceae bacterium]
MSFPRVSGVWLHLSRWAAVGALAASAGCGSKQTTGEALSAAGVVAVAAAVAVAKEPGGCREVKGSLPGDTEVRCQGGSDPKAARALVAGAGLGLTALGNELQRSALDESAQRKSRISNQPIHTAPKVESEEPAAQPATQTPCASATATSVVFLPTAPTVGAAGAGSGDSSSPCIAQPSPSKTQRW